MIDKKNNIGVLSKKACIEYFCLTYNFTYNEEENDNFIFYNFEDKVTNNPIFRIEYSKSRSSLNWCSIEHVSFDFFDISFLFALMLNLLFENVKKNKVEFIKCDNCSVFENFNELLQNFKIKIENGDIKEVINDINFLLK